MFYIQRFPILNRLFGANYISANLPGMSSNVAMKYSNFPWKQKFSFTPDNRQNVNNILVPKDYLDFLLKNLYQSQPLKPKNKNTSTDNVLLPTTQDNLLSKLS